MRDDSWKKEMEALMKWTQENWDKTGKRVKSAGLTGSLSLGSIDEHIRNQKKVNL